jgi:hypothetical protein
MLLAKIGGFFFLWWFYTTAKKLELPAIQWAVIGLIGYWLAWGVATLAVANPLLNIFAHSSMGLLLAIRQIPAIIACGITIFIRHKFLLGKAKEMSE